MCAFVIVSIAGSLEANEAVVYTRTATWKDGFADIFFYLTYNGIVCEHIW